MLLVLQHQDGRWCAPSIQDAAFSAETLASWPDAVAEALGLPAGSLFPFVVADDRDPRTGELIAEPEPERELRAALPSFEQRLAALEAASGIQAKG